jgi:hypothetical protein
MLKMSQWVQRTPGGESAWREEALSPVHRRALSLLREPLAVQQLRVSLQENDLVELERLITGLLRRGWIRVTDASPLEQELGRPANLAPEDNRSALESLLDRRGLPEASPAPIRPVLLPDYIEPIDLVMAPSALPQVIHDKQDAVAPAFESSDHSKSLPRPAFVRPPANDNAWRDSVSDESAAALLSSALASGAIPDLAEEAAQSIEASSTEASLALERAFAAVSASDKNQDPTAPTSEASASEVSAPVSEEASDAGVMAALSAAFAASSVFHSSQEIDEPTTDHPQLETVRFDDLASAMGITAPSDEQNKDDRDLEAFAEAVPGPPRRHSRMAESLIRSMDETKLRPSAKVIQGKKDQEATQRKQATIAQQEKFAAQRAREKAQQDRGTIHGLTEALRLKKLAREKSESNK